MRDEDRQLRAGHDYPIWAKLKWAHAQRLHSRLLNDYEIWRASLVTETRAEYSSDRRTVTLYATIANEPPLYEWSLAFGDVIHNYRSALDALAWGMAHLDDRQPRPQDANHIYFPLTNSRTAFNKLAEKRLSSVPEFVLNRIQSVQPYHGGSPEMGIGKWLHALDIQDKHRSAIEIRAVAAAETHYMIQTHYDDSMDSSVVNFEDEWVAPDGTVQDGDKIVILKYSQPVREVEIPRLPLELQVDYQDETTDVFKLLHVIDIQVGVTFQIIETGILPDPQDE